MSRLVGWPRPARGGAGLRRVLGFVLALCFVLSCVVLGFVSSIVFSLAGKEHQKIGELEGHLTLCVVQKYLSPLFVRPVATQGKTVTFELRSPEAGWGTRSVELDRTFPSTENPVLYRVRVGVALSCLCWPLLRSPLCSLRFCLLNHTCSLAVEAAPWWLQVALCQTQWC